MNDIIALLGHVTYDSQWSDIFLCRAVFRMRIILRITYYETAVDLISLGAIVHIELAHGKSNSNRFIVF